MPDDDEQLTFGVPRARRTDRQTSHEAAASVRRVTETQMGILRCFDKGNAMCDVDLAVVYQGRSRGPDTDKYPRASDSGLRTRRKELEDAGFVYDTGETTRLPSGRNATLFRLTQKGWDSIK